MLGLLVLFGPLIAAIFIIYFGVKSRIRRRNEILSKPLSSPETFERFAFKATFHEKGPRSPRVKWTTLVYGFAIFLLAVFGTVSAAALVFFSKVLFGGAIHKIGQSPSPIFSSVFFLFLFLLIGCPLMIPLTFSWGVAWTMIRRLVSDHRLVVQGISTDGVVLGIVRIGNKSWQIYYDFQDEFGQIRRGDSAIGTILSLPIGLPPVGSRTRVFLFAGKPGKKRPRGGFGLEGLRAGAPKSNDPGASGVSGPPAIWPHEFQPSTRPRGSWVGVPAWVRPGRRRNLSRSPAKLIRAGNFYAGTTYPPANI